MLDPILKSLAVILWLSPASHSPQLIALATDEADCDAVAERFDPLFADHVNRVWDCVAWSFAPEVSPRPIPKPEAGA